MTSRRETPKRRAFRDRYGPVALVTGAAQGIGRAFADAVASRGLSVFLLDVQAQAVERAAAEVAEEHGVSAWPLAIDLSRRDFLEDLKQGVNRQSEISEIGLVICNAAIGLEGPFLSESLEDLHRAVDVNCQAAVSLTHAFGTTMVERGSGGLILIASGTALQGSPQYANYAATKAFNLVLGESLWYELKDHGVDVLSFVPGPTNTPGMRKSIPRLKEGVEVGPIRLPSVTAESAIEALGRRASSARQKDHARRLAGRRRAADAMIERQAQARPTRQKGRIESD